MLNFIGRAGSWIWRQYRNSIKWPWKQSRWESAVFFVGTQLLVTLSILPLIGLAYITNLPLIPQLCAWVLLGLAISTLYPMLRKKRSDATITEAELLEQSRAAKKKQDPHWDRADRLAACRKGKEDGVDLDFLRRIYGEELVAEVLAESGQKAEAVAEARIDEKL